MARARTAALPLVLLAAAALCGLQGMAFVAPRGLAQARAAQAQRLAVPESEAPEAMETVEPELLMQEVGGAGGAPAVPAAASDGAARTVVILTALFFASMVMSALGFFNATSGFYAEQVARAAAKWAAVGDAGASQAAGSGAGAAGAFYFVAAACGAAANAGAKPRSAEKEIFVVGICAFFIASLAANLLFFP